MAGPKRVQVVAAVGGALLLAGAWYLTTANETDPATPTTSGAVSTTRPPSTTTRATTTTAAPRNPELGGLVLTDVTKAAGLAEPQAADTPRGADGQTGGAAVADYDDDGDLDVALPRLGLPTRLLRNDGTGRFTDVAEQAGATGPDQGNGYAAAVWADVEGDGDLDLYLTGAGRGGAALLVNDGSGRFSDGTAAAGLDGLAGDGLAGTASYGAAFDDWDHDGDLDLVTLQWYRAPLDLQLRSLGDPTKVDPASLDPCRLKEVQASVPGYGGLPPSRSALLANDGAGHFTDVTAASGVATKEIVAFQPVFADADGDGWEDLFITGDYCTSKLYRNDQRGRFTDITADAGVGTDRNGMGSVVEDLDGDGNLDWFVSAVAESGALRSGACAAGAPCTEAGNRAFLGDGAGHFRDATDELGVRDGSWGWGAAGADLNQDGRLDLALANGARYRDPGAPDDPSLDEGDPSVDDPTRVWVNTGAGAWPEVAATVGATDRTNGKALVAFDADGDGDLDLLIANTDDPPLLYRNDTPAGPEAHWLQLRLRAPGTTNPWAIGAEVTVDLGDGTPPRHRRVRAGGSFQSGDPTDLHLGLGPVDEVARIEVRWPGRTDPQVLTDVPVDQVLELTPR